MKDNDNKYNIKPITLTFELIQKEKKVSVTTYTYNDDNIYRNIALAEANGFSGYESVENSYSNSYSLSNLNKNTITIVEGKIYLKDAGKYRLYIKGKDNVFMYVSIKNNKNYLEVSEIFVIFVLLKFFEIIFGPIAQLVRAGDS